MQFRRQLGGVLAPAVCRRSHRQLIRPKHDLRGQYGEQAIEISVPRCRQERSDQLALSRQIGCRDFRSPNPTPGSTGELPGRRWGPLQDASDTLERLVEQIVQHKCDPFRRRQGLEDDQQRGACRIGQDKIVFGAPSPGASGTGSASK